MTGLHNIHDIVNGLFYWSFIYSWIKPSINISYRSAVLPSGCNTLYAHAHIFLQPKHVPRTETWQMGCNALTHTHGVTHTHTHTHTEGCCR